MNVLTDMQGSIEVWPAERRLRPQMGAWMEEDLEILELARRLARDEGNRQTMSRLVSSASETRVPDDAVPERFAQLVAHGQLVIRQRPLYAQMLVNPVPTSSTNLLDLAATEGAAPLLASSGSAAPAPFAASAAPAAPAVPAAGVAPVAPAPLGPAPAFGPPAPLAGPPVPGSGPGFSMPSLLSALPGPPTPEELGIDGNTISDRARRAELKSVTDFYNQSHIREDTRQRVWQDLRDDPNKVTVINSMIGETDVLPPPGQLTGDDIMSKGHGDLRDALEDLARKGRGLFRR